jgi:hypothetical protein
MYACLKRGYSFSMPTFFRKTGFLVSPQRKEHLSMKKQTFIALILSFMALFILTACNSTEANLRPVEREQIENVVKEFVVREESLPPYEVSIEAVDDGWARVSLQPEGVEGQPTLLYLQDQSKTEAPTAEAEVQPGNDARVETTSGWSIVLGPQVEFKTETLTEAGVPESLR